MVDTPFPWLVGNDLGEKPRDRGRTEVRGPYYTVLGRRGLADLLELAGPYVDSLKFSGGAFLLFDQHRLEELIRLCHDHDVLVSTGGFLEHALPRGPEAVDRAIERCKRLGFDIVEVSAGFLSLPADDHVRLVERVRQADLRAKPELGPQFGAGGTTEASRLQAAGTGSVERLVHLGQRFLDLGVEEVMIESEGLTEQVQTWRTDAIARIVDGLGLARVMFEAADPRVFQWYVKHYGADVNLFVDHSQVLQLATLRAGIWGPHDLWGRIHRYDP